MKDYYTIQNAHLEADETTLTVRTNELRRIPVEQIAGLHLLSGFQIASGVIELASKHEFPVHFYNYHGAYRGSFLPKPANATASPLVLQVKENQDPARRLQRAYEILDASNKGMLAMLSGFGLAPHPLPRADNLGDLRLSEARIRKDYYALCDTFLPDYWSIVKRERRPPRRPADAVLSFANGVLYAKTSGWIHRAGLDPRIGYIHGDARASNPLALDLAEIMKPFVSEGALFSIAASGQERSLVTDVGEGCYLNDKGRKAVLQVMEDLLSAETEIAIFDRRLTLARVGELLAVKLHRAIITDAPVVFPLPSCTLSSSTMRILNEGRTSVDSS